jgi:LysM repeat protein
MDTLSRDSNSSGSILPLVGVIAGGLALVLSIVALVKLSTVQKTVTAHEEAVQKVPAIESSASAAAAAASKADSDIKVLRDGIQRALDDVGNTIGTINAKITKIEEGMKKPAPAATKAGGAAAAPAGTLNADGTYTVRSGDTLSKIARAFNTKVDSIQAENPGLETIKPGQKIRIPKR